MDAKNSIKKMLYNSRMSQAQLARDIKVSQATVASYTERDVRSSTLARCAEATNHEVIIRNKITNETWLLDGSDSE